MNLNLESKLVLVTGGSKGIGLACAKAFLSEGARVAIVSRSRENLDTAQRYLKAEGFSVYTHPANLSEMNEAESMANMVEKNLGPIDILINCAGAAKRYPIQELNSQVWRDAMDAKFFTYTNATDAVGGRMVNRKQGAIVNIIGLGGKVASSLHLPGGAANAALMLVTVGLAQAYGREGVRVNAINPNTTTGERTNIKINLEANLRQISEAQVLAEHQAQIPMGRYANAEEIANVALFLASDKASYVTGAIIPMDGGLYPII
ncbi:conserved hypothetical protein [Candidatus Desulfosporosinus infrequens]|uniref:Uncharacterized protein n=1 Tax=Candidatus Desulfosporosinus infrequens TaxID=2043169 RepID=A0A2U3LPC9_9FIRM|nr:conserved hypothetical protein [Candidatus Desulfosporosinus infrequens]